MNFTRKTLIGVALLVVLIAAVVVVRDKTQAPQSVTLPVQQDERGIFSELTTDLTIADIPLELVLDGGPGKDGIPAIHDPQFVSVADSVEADDVLGIFLDINGDQRFYPYSILVWHEIVNDVVGERPVSVTFCPLCGSAIVFERLVSGELLTFGVSGLLFESNLLMYDREGESLWSQARGEAVVGEKTGARLELVPMQLLTFAEVKDKFPDAQVLSRKTGYMRNYDVTPYTGYEETEDVIFPVSVSDERFFAKEIMHVVPFEDVWFTFPEKSLRSGASITERYNDQNFLLERSGGEITVTGPDGNVLPGYFEMWFSFATHHQDDGVVWEL